MKVALTLILYCAAAAAAPAQTPSPVTVSGIVQDQTGAVLPGATVELVNAGGAAECRQDEPEADGMRERHQDRPV